MTEGLQMDGERTGAGVLETVFHKGLEKRED